MEFLKFGSSLVHLFASAELQFGYGRPNIWHSSGIRTQSRGGWRKHELQGLEEIGHLIGYIAHDISLGDYGRNMVIDSTSTFAIKVRE
jgi:hypothetical protein